MSRKVAGHAHEHEGLRSSQVREMLSVSALPLDENGSSYHAFITTRYNVEKIAGLHVSSRAHGLREDVGLLLCSKRVV